MMVSPESVQFLESLRSQPTPAGLAPWVKIRKAFGEGMAALPLPPGVQVVLQAWGGVPCELLMPTDSDARKLIMYLHGGGNVVGSLDSHRELTARIAANTRVPVLNVGFRNGPEFPFPAAIDDAAAVYFALCAGRSSADIAVAGDSAGGGVAVALLLRLRNSGGAMPAFAILISPCLDLSLSFAEAAGPAADPTFDLDSTRHLFNQYIGPADPKDPMVSPVFSAPEGIPPLLIQSGSLEGFLPDARAFHHKALASGVASTMEEYEGQIHDFHALAPTLPESLLALSSIAAYARTHWQLPA